MKNKKEKMVRWSDVITVSVTIIVVLSIFLYILSGALVFSIDITGLDEELTETKEEFCKRKGGVYNPRLDWDCAIWESSVYVRYYVEEVNDRMVLKTTNEN